ncbi:hypothetical protein [Brucella pituitosa]|uniref:Uncharacterized protein n=1 Tax=Brucella pituitosa TaxID=571256 RepID=A0A643EZC2_9HYPH|nr:hypothetical protein [Brucella pituitosa]KAB0571074.1 hypothetical protein F7Q93_14005 [Brucella pituitosa]
MNSTNKKLVADAFGQTVQDGQAIARTIQEAADDLAFLMQQLHGEPFRSDINHEVGYLLICLKNKGASS